MGPRQQAWLGLWIAAVIWPPIPVEIFNEITNRQTWDLNTIRAQKQSTLISRFRDNPEVLVNRRVPNPFTPVGELETVATTGDASRDKVKHYGTGVLVSPCYVLTNHHVVFGDDIIPHKGKDYTMTFRVGVGRDLAEPFLGRTLATPISWGNRGVVSAHDWALLKLSTCVGAFRGIGWMETSSKSSLEMIGVDVAAVGYAADRSRGELSLSVGKATAIDPLNGLIKYSASAAGGQSGGAVIIRENSVLKLMGLHTLGRLNKSTGQSVFDTYRVDAANEFVPISEVLERSSVQLMINEDISRYIANPAKENSIGKISSFPVF